jgi:eukaryotic-like serine/threonine-protein kinase
MPLSPGDKLGPYEILSPIGKGGMGEVYKACDTRLDRTVALKVSSAQFSERFEREAKAIAALNHSNICTLHDVGPNYLVMEYIEGTPLKGPLPLDQALKYAVQICDALDAAHKKGITHRDLKPANILVTKAGIKLLDFGLAKLGSSGIGQAPKPDDATLTMALTGKNEIVGTLYYMSPEQLQSQATGQEIDGRSDIFSFGLVLYEMLTGKRAFEGASPASVIAAIMERPAPSIANVAPAALDRVLQRCLAKDPDDRWQTARDLKAELEWITHAPEGAPESGSAVQKSRLGWVTWTVAGVLGMAAVAAGFGWWRATQPVDRPLIRLSVDLGKDAERDDHVSAILSPDGTRVVYTARGAAGFRELYTRRLDQPTATLLASGTRLEYEPFFSPKGDWVGYWSLHSNIVKVPAQGGEPITLGATPQNFQGASWGDDDNIILGSNTGLWRMPARGGAAEFVKGTAGEKIDPQVLPGAQAVLVNTGTPSGGTLDAFDIDVVQLATGEKKNLVHGGYWPHYLPTSGQTGHLVYVRAGALYGVGFDPRSLTLLGTPTPLLNDVAANSALLNGGGQIAFSHTGTVVYLSGKAQDATYPISWLDASGKVTTVVAQPGAYGSPRVSPDGKHLVYIAAASNDAASSGYNLWVYDLDRGTPTQLTFAGEVVNEVAWARDSKHLAYQDGESMWWIRSDGGGQKQLLLDGKELGNTPLGPRPFSFAPAQGKDARLAFSPASGGLPDVLTLPIDLTDPEHPKPGKPEPFLADPAIVEVDPAFSPDGKFMAYASTESGTEEVYVRPFPGPGGKWKVSTSGGAFPAWSPATNELFFLGGDDRIMATSYTIQGDSFTVSVPRVWSPTPVRRISVQLNFDITPDGKRVIMFPQPVAEESTGNLHATFLLNFFDELRRKVPLK